MFSRCLKYISIFWLLTILCIPGLFIPLLLPYENTEMIAYSPESTHTPTISSNFAWPIPGYTRISSSFGRRVSPTTGASSFHLGIDIPAPAGTNLIAPIDSIVTFTGFKGSGGYTIILACENFQLIYHHVSPYFFVKKGDYITKGNIIGQVGPKYVYNVTNNPYHDQNGKPTNGATTGPHLHFSIKKDGIAVNPLDYISTNYISSSTSSAVSSSSSQCPLQLEQLCSHALCSSSFQSSSIV